MNPEERFERMELQMEFLAQNGAPVFLRESRNKPAPLWTEPRCAACAAHSFAAQAFSKLAKRRFSRHSLDGRGTVTIEVP